MRWPVFVSGIHALIMCSVSAPSLARAERAGLIVPAYQYPTAGTLWGDCAAAASRVPVVAIMNPASGPGSGMDPNYVAAVGSVRSAGGRVIGYVPTFEAGIPVDSALVSVDRYRAWYSLDGILVDGMTHDSNSAHIAWYAALRDSIRAREPGWLVVGIPGTNTIPDYFAGADILGVFESYGESYFSWEPSAWVRSYPPSRFLHLVHSLSTADSMRRVVARALSLQAGWVYVTNDQLPNPWDEAPIYWDQLIAAVDTTQTVAVETSQPFAMRLRAWPNPARGAIHFDFPDGMQPSEIEILDCAGRCVARIGPGSRPEWDGLGRDGLPAPSGIYFSRVRGSRADPVRVALVR